MTGAMFDAYGRQARLAPALLTLFPVFVSVAAWLPTLYELATGLVGLAVACGVTTAFAHFARSCGRVMQQKLINELGALPTTLWLRRSDNSLDPQTKQRYYNFLETNVSEWRAPTPQEEKDNSSEADQKYDSAVRWLLEFTRDTKKYPLVFKENIFYGFRRNVLGLKPYAVLIASFAVGFGIFQLYGISLADLISKQPAQTAAVAVSFVLSIWWVFIVNRAWVLDAANAYARALLAVCDGN